MCLTCQGFRFSSFAAPVILITGAGFFFRAIIHRHTQEYACSSSVYASGGGRVNQLCFPSGLVHGLLFAAMPTACAGHAAGMAIRPIITLVNVATGVLPE